MTAEIDRLARALGDNASDLLGYFRRRAEPVDAADLLAETATIAWRRASALPRTDEDARRWLFGVARNVLANHRRGEQRRHALADRVRGVLERAPSPAADAGAEVRDAIDRLSPELAETVRLIHWDGMSVTDVARITGVSVSTARDRYRRARNELREALLDR